MARRIELTIEDFKATAVATLLEEAAPATCDFVWGQLPRTVEGYSARWGGRHIATVFPTPPPSVAPENRTIFAAKGDLVLFHIMPGNEDILRDRETMSSAGVGDLSIFYARQSYLLGPAGHVPGTLFATITSGLDAFVAACERIWRLGPRSIRLRPSSA